MPQALDAPNAIRLTALSPGRAAASGKRGSALRGRRTHAHGKIEIRPRAGLRPLHRSVMAQCASTASRHARRGHQDRRKP